MADNVLHPPKGCGDLRTLWFRYFEETLVRLKRYHPDDMLTTRQAAYALYTRQGTLFNIAKYDRSAALGERIGPSYQEVADSSKSFRPARTYRVSDLLDWIDGLVKTRRTIYGEPILFGDKVKGDKRNFGNLARMVNMSARNTTAAEKIAARFLLRIGADLTDRIAEAIADDVSKRLTAQALKDTMPDDADMEVTKAPLDTGFIKAVDNIPDRAWPLSDPRVTGRSISQAQFRLALRALGMTARQFAEFWGVSDRTAYAWHDGSIPVPLAVADYLKHTVGQFVRLRCVQLGVPVPTTEIDRLELPRSKASERALDTLRAMLQEGNPDGLGHEGVIGQNIKGKATKPFSRRQPTLTPMPDDADPVPDEPSD